MDKWIVKKHLSVQNIFVQTIMFFLFQHKKVC